MRGWSGRRLEHEVGKLEAAGTQVIVLTPSAEDLALMGTNLMSRKRRSEVTEQALRSATIELRRRRADLPNLVERTPAAPVKRAA